MQNIQVFDDCVHELSRLPGVGRKTAVRLALHILKIKPEQAYKLSDAIKKLKDNIKFFRNREEFMYGMIIRLENGMRGLVAEEVRK